jgi:hypothetical protein
LSKSHACGVKERVADIKDHGVWVVIMATAGASVHARETFT